MLMTAAGTLAPARALVMGAGVAGLQACATAKRLGAVVEAYDVRPAAQEQIISVRNARIEHKQEFKSEYIEKTTGLQITNSEVVSTQVEKDAIHVRLIPSYAEVIVSTLINTHCVASRFVNSHFSSYGRIRLLLNWVVFFVSLGG